MPKGTSWGEVTRPQRIMLKISSLAILDFSEKSCHYALIIHKAYSKVFPSFELFAMSSKMLEQ